MEGYFLFNLCYLAEARSGFEIGTGSGYSALWLSAGIVDASGTQGWFGSMDDHSEGGIGDAGHEFATRAILELGFENTVRLFVGTSPSDVQRFLDGRTLDVVFIDGNHHGEHPIADYEALKPYLEESAIIIWHDVHPSYRTPAAVAHAREDGFHTDVFATSCRIAVSWRVPSRRPMIMKAFEDARRLKLSEIA